MKRKNPRKKKKKFYTDAALEEGQTVALLKEEAHHLINVMRLRKGDEIKLFNNYGQSGLAVIKKADKKKGVSVQILEVACEKAEDEEGRAIKLTAAVAMIPKQKMDFIAEKACEIGINRLIPLETARSVLTLSGEKYKKVSERWRRIVVQAAKQSGYSDVTEIERKKKFGDLVKSGERYDEKIMLHPLPSAVSILDKAVQLKRGAKRRKIIVLVGPEGGFTEKEVSAAKENGFEAVSLGRKLLKVETAVILAGGILKNL